MKAGKRIRKKVLEKYARKTPTNYTTQARKYLFASAEKGKIH